MGGVSRLLDVLERIATTANASEIEVSILLAVFKALFNVCADDCVAGEPLPLRPAVTEDEVTTLEAIIEHIRGSEDFADQDDLVQMSERLLGQVLQISGKYEARNLEELPQ